MREQAVTSAKPLVGVAVFDVLADVEKLMIEEIKTRYGIQYQRNDLRALNFGRRFQDDTRDPTVLSWYYSRLRSNEFLYRLQPNEGAREFWSYLGTQPVERRMLVPPLKDLAEASLRHWLDAFLFHGRIDFALYPDGWARQTKATWIVVSDSAWAQQMQSTSETTTLLFHCREEIEGRHITSLLDAGAIICNDY